MSKSRNHYHKRFDDEYEYTYDEDERKAERKIQERRRQKKMKNALRTKDIEVLANYDELE